MKKLSLLLAVALLAACGNGGSAATKGEFKTAESDKGDYSTATVEVKDGKVVKATIDTVQGEGGSKKEAGSSYGMKDASAIGKEWDEQIKFLEDYIAKNGADAVKLDSQGYPTEEDLLAGCTINLGQIMEAVNGAKDAAK